jgi:hypothetical protein
MSAPLPTARGGLHPRTRLLLALLLLAPFGVTVAKLGISEADDVLAAAGVPGTRVGEPIPRDAETGLPKPMLGFAINAHHISKLPLYLDGVDAIADLGANTLIVVTPMFQKRVDSTRIRTLRSRCPTDEQLSAILRRARQHGLCTVLMPIVLLEDPGENDWRGLIRPKDWDDWWASYRTGLDRFVDLAVEHDVDLLSVGSELNTTEDQVVRWMEIVSDIRARYDGRLMYSANWDRYSKVRFWELVDVMSVSSYFELERDRPGAPVVDLVRAWKPVREMLVAEAERLDKPLMLSEVGYPSLPWANAHPWNYVAEDGVEADHEAQARSWQAFFRAWHTTISDPASRVLGLCGYRWDPYRHGDASDTGYGIVGKPSREVIRSGFSEIRRANREW